MFEKKYTPSVKNNMQIKEKAVGEVGAFIYRLERGRFDSEADKDAVIRIIEDLKFSVESLKNTVGTGEEDIVTLANNILSLLKELKKIMRDYMRTYVKHSFKSLQIIDELMLK